MRPASLLGFALFIFIFHQARAWGTDQQASTITKVTIETVPAPQLELRKIADQREIPATRFRKRRRGCNGSTRCRNRRIFLRSEDIEKELDMREKSEAMYELERELEKRELKEEEEENRKALKNIHQVLITII